ncbi:MAG: bacillithiol biosynthesis deacetylase BshB1 [Bacteroidetes bacterium]|nr:bacillithiol biosynthesis deacetylase BshB1 [Bacteroidota bacterium]
MKIDAIVFAAHPDDAELSMGGTIAKLASHGMKVGIIDCTRGELGTRGSAEIRQHEAIQAGIVLKAEFRDNFNIPDGEIQVNRENLLKFIHAIRKYKPKVIFAPYFNDRHPDHIAVSQLAKQAYFYSGVGKIHTFENEHMQPSYRPSALYYYMQTYEFEPSFIVDISGYFDTKMKSVKAFSSQFFDPKNKEPETFISKQGFLDFIESRSKLYGFRIGKDYGEAFYSEEAIELDLVHKLKH